MSYKHEKLDLTLSSPKPLSKSHAKLILLEPNLLEAPSLHLAKEGEIIHVLVSAYKPFLRNKYLNLSNDRVWYF